MTTRTPSPHSTPDHYLLLGIPRDASPNTIKRAYHQLVLLHHPDKQARPHPTAPDVSRTGPGPGPAGNGAPVRETIDIGQLTAAYATLSSPEKRRAYDVLLRDQRARLVSDGSREPVGKQRRPAEVVSLDEFAMSADAAGEVWTYACRCGDTYRIRERDMERDVHLLECGGCSEVVWVEYEEAGEDLGESEAWRVQEYEGEYAFDGDG